MKAKKGFKLLCLFLCVCLLAPAFTACSGGDDIPSEADTYYTSLAVKYDPSGKYTGTLSFTDEVEDTFTENCIENFVLTAYRNVGGEEIEVVLNDCSVKKTDEKNLEFTFRTPFGYGEDVSYILTSEAPVTKNELNVSAIIFLLAPEPALSIDYTGAYYGTDAVTVTATLTDGWHFVSELSPDMLCFPQGFQASVAVERKNDSEALFTVTDLPENYYGSILAATLRGDAFDSEVATDVRLELDYFHPELVIDPTSVSFDRENATLTVGKMTLPEGTSGVSDGISAPLPTCSVVTSAYNVAERTYSFTLALNPEVTTELVLPYITVNATIKRGEEEILCPITPYAALAGIKGNVITDTENDKLSIELVPYNATFADDFSANDVTVTGADALSGFTLSTATPDKLVYVADYSEAFTEGVALSFDMDDTALNSEFSLSYHSLLLYVPPYSDGRAVDWEEMGGKLASGAASGLGSMIGSSVAGFVLPYVYEFLGVDASDPELNAIRTSIEQLTFAINDLSGDIHNVTVAVEAGTNRMILDNFQSIETSLQTSSLKLLSDEDVASYVAYLTTKFKNTVEEHKRALNAWSEFEEFERYYRSATSNYHLSTGAILAKYNMLVPLANNANPQGFFSYTRFAQEFSHSSFSEEYSSGLDAGVVYSMLSGKHVCKDQPEPTLDIARNPNFEAAVDKVNYNNAYVNNVIEYGNRILGNASGTSAGIIDLFFKVVDTMYNFESQTIDVKQAFVTKVKTNYLLSSAIALQYCDAVKDTGNAAVIRSSVDAVMKKIENANIQIALMRERAMAGLDRLLVTGDVVSKTLRAHMGSDLNAKKYEDKNWTAFNNLLHYNMRHGEKYVFPGAQGIRTMIARASQRGLSLAEDLTQAGFTGLSPNKSVMVNAQNTEEYLYLTDRAYLKEGWSVGELMGKGMLSAFGASVDYRDVEVYANYVAQSGRDAGSVHNDVLLAKKYRHYEHLYDSNHYYWGESFFGVIISFKAP